MYTHEPQDLIVYFFISKVKCRALQIYCTCSSTVFSSNFPVELFRDLQLFKITTMPGTNAKVARTYIFMQWPHFNLQTCSFEELCIHENAPTCNIHAQRSYKRRYGKLKYTSWKSMKGGKFQNLLIERSSGFFLSGKIHRNQNIFLTKMWHLLHLSFGSQSEHTSHNILTLSFGYFHVARNAKSPNFIF